MKTLKNSGIYCILNIVNNKMYIGSSTNMVRRRREHLYALRDGKHTNSYLQHAFTKYGETSFKFIWLENNIDKCDLLQKELDWIILKNTTNDKIGYNLILPSVNNYTWTEKFSKDAKRTSLTRYRGEMTDLEYENLLLELEEIKLKKLATTNERLNKQKIVVLDKITNDLLYEFASTGIAAKELNFKSNRIEDAVANRIKTYKGFIFMYKSKYDSSINYAALVERKLKPIYQYSKDYVLLNTYTSITIPEEFNLNTLISYITMQYSYKDYIWSRHPLTRTEFNQYTINSEIGSEEYYIKQRENSLKAVNITSKPIIQCDLDNNFIKEWYSMAEADRYFNTKGNVTKVLDKSNLSYKGSRWYRKVNYKPIK